MTYQVGQRIRVQGTFTNESDVAADPTTVTVQLTNPSRVKSEFIYGTDAEVVKSATGIYYMDFTVSASGWWIVRFVGTGLVAAQEELLEVEKLQTPLV